MPDHDGGTTSARDEHSGGDCPVGGTGHPGSGRSSDLRAERESEMKEGRIAHGAGRSRWSMAVEMLTRPYPLSIRVVVPAVALKFLVPFCVEPYPNSTSAVHRSLCWLSSEFTDSSSSASACFTQHTQDKKKIATQLHTSAEGFDECANSSSGRLSKGAPDSAYPKAGTAEYERDEKRGSHCTIAWIINWL